MEPAAILYLKGAIGRWKSHLPADTNVRIFKMLFEYDPDNRATYTKEILHWQTVKVHRDHLKHFPELIQHGKFFVVFAEYYRSMEFWGLRSDIRPDELRKRFRVRPDERRSKVKDWKAKGGLVPVPIRREHGRGLVSADFLCLGTYIFEPPNDNDPSLTGDQMLFNRASERALPQLLDMIVSLPELPRPIGELLSRYARRLYRSNGSEAAPAER